jgi:hypothetical protein
MKLEELILNLDTVLRAKNLNNYSKLYSPLAQEEIHRLVEALNINSNELEMLYTWKNGFGDFQTQDCQIFDFGVQLPLYHILGLYNSNNGEVGRWENEYIPIGTDGSGHYLLFNNRKGIDNGKLYLYSPSLLHVEPISYYDNVRTMLETILMAYDLNIFSYVEADDWLEKDYNRFYELGKRLNPLSDYWKQ